MVDLSKVPVPQKPISFQRAVKSELNRIGDIFPLISQFNRENTAELPIVSTNITSVQGNTQTYGRFFSEGVNPSSLLGKFLQETFGDRFLDKPLVHISNPTKMVVAHEVTHASIAEIVKKENRGFFQLLPPLFVRSKTGSLSTLNEEDYVRLLDLIRFPANEKERKSAQDYFQKFRSPPIKISVDKLLQHSSVLKNIMRLQQLGDKINVDKGKPPAPINFPKDLSISGDTEIK